MIEKIRSLTWETYSVLLMIIAYATVVVLTSQVILNTKDMSNSSIIIAYTLLGLFVTGLIKINNANSKSSSKR